MVNAADFANTPAGFIPTVNTVQLATKRVCQTNVVNTGTVARGLILAGWQDTDIYNKLVELFVPERQIDKSYPNWYRTELRNANPNNADVQKYCPLVSNGGNGSAHRANGAPVVQAPVVQNVADMYAASIAKLASVKAMLADTQAKHKVAVQICAAYRTKDPKGHAGLELAASTLAASIEELKATVASATLEASAMAAAHSAFTSATADVPKKAPSKARAKTSPKTEPSTEPSTEQVA